MNDYIFFWGCTIPNRFPFLEKSMRLVLDQIGVSYREIEGFTCCPEKFLIETLSEEDWYLTAARNLALAERNGGDLLVACNGCYSSFRAAITAFQASTTLRNLVSERLAEIGLEYNFRSSVHHIVEVLHDKIGPAVISRKVTRPLTGMRIAAHYGCQLLRPGPVVRLDDPSNPKKLDRLIESIGARSLDYSSKLLCCGEALGRSGCPEESQATARIKLQELSGLEADALSVVCPACFQQFEGQQLLIKRDNGGIHIPVFYFTELLGLAMGFEPEEMGFDMHRIEVSAFLGKLAETERIRSSLPPEYDYDTMSTCLECGSCSNDCPVSQVDDSYDPHAVIRAILDGELEAVIEGEDIWKCLECGTCTELCPNSFGMTTVIKQAKREAMARGIAPAETCQGIDMFRQTGVLGKERKRARDKLGLGPVAATGGDELEKLLGKAVPGKDE